MDQGILRNGLRVIDVGLKKFTFGSSRPLKGFIIYPKGDYPSSNLIEWTEEGKFRLDGQPHEFDLINAPQYIPPMTVRQSAVYEFLLEKAYSSVKKVVETVEEMETVKEACKMLHFASDLIALTKATAVSSIEEDAANLAKILLFLSNNNLIEIFGIDGKQYDNTSYVPKLYCL